MMKPTYSSKQASSCTRFRSRLHALAAAILACHALAFAPACLNFEAAATDITEGPGLALFSALLASAAAANSSSQVRTKFVYITYRNNNNLRIFNFDNNTGMLTETGDSPVATGMQPIGVCMHPDQTFLYVAERNSNTIAGFSINQSTGALTAVPGSPFAAGTQPWDCEVHPGGGYLVASPANANMERFTIGADGALTSLGPQGSGGNSAQSMLFSKDGGFLYASNAISGDITANIFDPGSGNLTPVGGSPFAASAFMRQLALSPDEDHLYVPSRNTTNLHQYSLSSGALSALAPPTLTYTGQGMAAAVSPDGVHMYLGLQTTNAVTIYDRNAGTGVLTASAVPSSPAGFPQGLYFEPGGNYLFALSSIASNNVNVFSRDVATGALTDVGGSPFNFGDSPHQAAFFTETVSQ